MPWGRGVPRKDGHLAPDIEKYEEMVGAWVGGDNCSAHRFFSSSPAVFKSAPYLVFSGS